MRLIRKARKTGVQGGFSLQVGAVSLKVHRGSEPTRLRLPKAHRFKQVIFNDRFHKFLSEVVAEPNRPRSYSVKNNEADVTISYNPRDRFFTGGHPSYTVVHSLRRNPVANALGDKADQIKRSGFTGPCGVILCDGGCEMLRSHMHDWSSYSLSEVIQEFFRQHSSIDFILVIYICQDGGVGPKNLVLRTQLYPNRRGSPLHKSVIESIQELCSALPRPFKDANNARYFLSWLRNAGRWNVGDSLIGGVTMSGRLVKISSRAVLDLLAGQIDQREFFSRHGFEERNPFLREMRHGRLITNVRIEKSQVPENDDEWLVFEFGDVDPAISPFTG
jgi:hypothetical protein